MNDPSSYSLTIKDSFESISHQNIHVPITIAPTNDTVVKIESNPPELMYVKDSILSDLSLDASIDKSVLVQVDESSNTGIMIKVPKDKLSQIEIQGGYHVNISKGFTSPVERILVHEILFGIMSNKGYAAPKVNADFTSLTENAYIRNVAVTSAYMVLKTNAPISRSLSVGSNSHRSNINDNVEPLGYSPTALIIEGNMAEPIAGESKPFVQLQGPSTKLEVDGNMDLRGLQIDSARLVVTGLISVHGDGLSYIDTFEVDDYFGKGFTHVHAGGIQYGPDIKFSSRKNDLFVLIPDCTDTTFDTSRWSEWAEYSAYAKCLEVIEPQLSVNFIDFENLPKDSTLIPNASPSDNDNSSDGNLDNVLPDPSDNDEDCQSSKKLPTWKIIVPPFIVAGVALLIGLYVYRRVKTGERREPVPSKHDEREELANSQTA